MKWISLLVVLVFSQTVFAANTRYDAVKASMVSLAGKFPNTTKIIVIGESDSKIPILGLQIGQGSINNLVVATHHGNEFGSTYVSLAFAGSVAENPLPDQTMFIIPVLNIEGYNANNRREPAKNTTWDPNRNYPGPCGTEGPFTLKSTATLAKFIDATNIVNSTTLHTYAKMILYPWGISTRDTSTPYDHIFSQLGLLASQESKYQVGNSTDLLYPADGTFEDYAFWKHGIWSLLFELGDSHSPSQNDMRKMAAENVPGLRRMFQMAPKQRAPNHAFTGKCETRFRSLDRHDE